MATFFHDIQAIKFKGYTTAQRNALTLLENLFILNTETSQFELYLGEPPNGQWYGILRLNPDGTITPAHHGPFVNGDLHNEYARTQVPEEISGGWKLVSGGSLRCSQGDEPVGEIAVQLKTTTGAPTHSASAGVPCWVMPDTDLYVNDDGGTNWTKFVKQSSLDAIKVSKSIVFASPGEDLAVEDWLSDQAIRVPAAGKHGTWTPGTIYVRVGTAGTGTNTILFRTSTTLTGTRTTRATVNLGTAREASAAITWTPANGEYLWVAVSAVGATAPKKGVAQVDIEETAY